MPQQPNHATNFNSYKPTTVNHAQSAPNALKPPSPPTNYGWKITPKTNPTNNAGSATSFNSNQNAGYGHSSASKNIGWKPAAAVGTGIGTTGGAIAANKNWQTSSSPNTFNSNAYGTHKHSNSNANYPRQQYIHPQQSSAYANTQYHPQSHQPQVVNNYFTNNHQTTHYNPGFSHTRTTHFSSI